MSASTASSRQFSRRQSIDPHSKSSQAAAHGALRANPAIPPPTPKGKPAKYGLGEDSMIGQEIKHLESESFNADQFMQAKCKAMSEKSLRKLCAELVDFKRASAEEMRKSVYANYKSFIRTAKEISELEGELRNVRSLLTAQSTLIHSLSDRSPIVQSHLADPDRSVYEDDKEASSQEANLLQIPDKMAVCLAERRIDEALDLLAKGEDAVVMCRAGQRPAVNKDSLETLDSSLAEKRAELVDLLARITLQPSVRRAELRHAVAALARLGDPKRAHTLMLACHGAQVQAAVQPLRPGGVSYGAAYTAKISRLVFSTILAAAQDSKAVFGDTPSCASELVLWAHGQTEWCGDLLQQYVLTSAAAAGGLRLAAECVQIAVGHCSLLEDHGLAMAAVLMRLVRPNVELALEANIRRIEESVQAMAAGDDWSLLPVPSAPRSAAARMLADAPVANFQLTSSAYRLYSMVQDFLEDVVPIVNLQLTTPTLDGLAHLYSQYTAMLNRARTPEDSSDWDASASAAFATSTSQAGGPGDAGEGEGGGAGAAGIVNKAVTDRQQLALIANAVTLAEELPRLAARLTQPVAGQRASREQRRSSGGEAKRQQLLAWKKQLSEGVEDLKMGFCMQKATELLYPDACMDDALLPHLYFLMDQVESDPSLWFNDAQPSEALKNFLFMTLTVSDAASEVLAGRDRLVLQLLTQYGLALLTLICHDKAWEDSHNFVGPTGLQQFLMDISFLKEVAARYHFTSRQLQQVADTSMERARESFDLNRFRGKLARAGTSSQSAFSVQCNLVRKVNGKELDALLSGDRPLPMVIDFYATWCGPCILLAQELEQLAVEYHGEVLFLKVDTDEEYELANQLEIRGLPTVVFVSKDKSKLAVRTEGLLPIASIKQLIEEM
ncbi:unnamed protein product [Closterium sp. NIES-65]|nr:unnamed protein product [Closterium sp. NIES-65]